MSSARKLCNRFLATFLFVSGKLRSKFDASCRGLAILAEVPPIPLMHQTIDESVYWDSSHPRL